MRQCNENQCERSIEFNLSTWLFYYFINLWTPFFYLLTFFPHEFHSISQLFSILFSFFSSFPTNSTRIPLLSWLAALAPPIIYSYKGTFLSPYCNNAPAQSHLTPFNTWFLFIPPSLRPSPLQKKPCIFYTLSTCILTSIPFLRAKFNKLNFKVLR